MKVILNIENDKELRDHIKKAITQQVKSLTREEITETIVAELRGKIKAKNEAVFDQIVKDAIKQVVRGLMVSNHKISEWNKDFIKPYIEESLKKSLQGVNLEKLVDEAASAKLKALIK